MHTSNCPVLPIGSKLGMKKVRGTLKFYVQCTSSMKTPHSGEIRILYFAD